ncbi:hypothetical protein, partial [Acinetobacter indicus]|uniref:hypothetical protein n=1 Tax=Acinetobacter indicus TaxID=756892 RepID=UPI001C0A4B78
DIEIFQCLKIWIFGLYKSPIHEERDLDQYEYEKTLDQAHMTAVTEQFNFNCYKGVEMLAVTKRINMSVTK